MLILLLLLFYYSYSAFMHFTYPIKYTSEVLKNAKKYKINKYLLLATIREESRFNNNSVSEKGAIGLMQLMPTTAKWISLKRGIAYNEKHLQKVNYNIDQGSWYLNYLLKHYNNLDLALASYNGGTKKVDQWLAQNPRIKFSDHIFPETKNYIISVKKSTKIYKDLYPDL